MLGDVVGGIGGAEDLGFIDEVAADRLQDLSFDDMSDTGLGHDLFAKSGLAQKILGSWSGAQRRTGMVTASMISLIILGSDIRATPPSLRISAGTRSRACRDAVSLSQKRGPSCSGMPQEKPRLRIYHDGTSPSLFGDAGLIGIDDIHDDASFEHLSESTLARRMKCQRRIRDKGRERHSP
jgi:hypothetical protein